MATYPQNIQMRVCVVLKYWLENHILDFSDAVGVAAGKVPKYDQD